MPDSSVQGLTWLIVCAEGSRLVDNGNKTRPPISNCFFQCNDTLLLSGMQKTDQSHRATVLSVTPFGTYNFLRPLPAIRFWPHYVISSSLAALARHRLV